MYAQMPVCMNKLTREGMQCPGMARYLGDVDMVVKGMRDDEGNELGRATQARNCNASDLLLAHTVGVLRPPENWTRGEGGGKKSCIGSTKWSCCVGALNTNRRCRNERDKSKCCYWSRKHCYDWRSPDFFSRCTFYSFLFLSCLKKKKVSTRLVAWQRQSKRYSVIALRDL